MSKNSTVGGFDPINVTGIGEYSVKNEVLGENSQRNLYLKGEKVFLVVNKNTIEVRTDDKLAKLLREKYESVMESRYFGRGGIEIVLAGEQIPIDEIEDLVRLSYNLTEA